MTNPRQNNEGSVELVLELENSKRKIYFKIFFDPDEIWIDTKSLPPTAFLCMGCDGVPLIKDTPAKTKETRFFVNIEWVINEWGGHPELVDALKERKQKILDDMPKYRKLIA